MVNLGKRRPCSPLIVSTAGDSTRLEQLSLTKKGEGAYDEKWIQNLISDHPELLPINEIEPAFSPLICIGNELSTNVGPLDVLYVNPDGYLTLVETKLWRNPEARREVVGQIIDYAKELSKLSFEDLDMKVRAYYKSKDGKSAGIIDKISEVFEINENSQSAVIDTINKNLERGRFLLLIVGDGIRERVEDMAEFLGNIPQLHFTLALVELQVFGIPHEEQDFLVVPQLVARTREITRAIVKYTGISSGQVTVEVETAQREKTKPGTGSTLTEQDFMERLEKKSDDQSVATAQRLMRDVTELGCDVSWAKASFVVKYSDTQGVTTDTSLLIVYDRGVLNIGQIRWQLGRTKLPGSIAQEFLEGIAKLFNVGIRASASGGLDRDIPLDEVAQKYDQLIALVKKVLDNIEKAVLDLE